MNLLSPKTAESSKSIESNTPPSAAADVVTPGKQIDNPARNRYSQSMSSPPLEHAIAQTLAYGDIFDYAMTAAEIHRYLTGVSAPLSAVRAALEVASAPGGWIEREGVYHTLAGRRALAQTRLARSRAAERLWPLAQKFGRHIARLPFVRMVAVTGSLAVDNVAEHADLDYLVVTSRGRLWICRAILVLLARVPASIIGSKICFNYVVALTGQSLAFEERNLYTAHEVAQMVPLAGRKAYEQLRRQNDWVLDFLPNACGAPARAGAVRRPTSTIFGFSALSMAVETLLTLPIFDRLEVWEMRRKIHSLQRRGPSAEAVFSSQVCKGHFDSHQEKTLTAFSARLADLETSRALTDPSTSSAGRISLVQGSATYRTMKP